MKPYFRMLLCLPVALFFKQTTGIAQVSIPLKLKPYIQVNKIPLGVKLPPKDSLKKSVDPAATAINFSVVSRIDNSRARVKIEGIVKNIGRDDYNSNPNQQLILLYERHPGGTPSLTATKTFQNLAKGAEIKIDFVREWDRSVEFPPDYVLVISYDPDIYLDANPNNNDINSINNKKEKSSVEINRLKW